MSNAAIAMKKSSSIRIIHAVSDFIYVPMCIEKSGFLAIDPKNTRELPLAAPYNFNAETGLNILLTRSEWVKGPFSIYSESRDENQIKFVQQQTNFFGFGLFLSRINEPKILPIGVGQMTTWPSWREKSSGSSIKVPNIVRHEMHNLFGKIGGTGIILAGGEKFMLTKGASIYFSSESIRPQLPFPYDGIVQYLAAG